MQDINDISAKRIDRVFTARRVESGLYAVTHHNARICADGMPVGWYVDGRCTAKDERHAARCRSIYDHLQWLNRLQEDAL